MGKRRDEIDTSTAARILEVNAVTVRRWAIARVEGRVSRVQYARRDVVGRYWLSKSEVIRLRDLIERGPVEAA